MIEAKDNKQAQPEALFYSVRAAIAFAYTISEFPIASSPKLLPGTGGGGRLASLSAHEKHAQGALIRRTVETKLKGIDLAVTFAHHGSGKVRSMAIREVGNTVAKLVRKSGLGVELAKRLFSRNGEKKSQSELSIEYGLSQPSICRLEGVVACEIHRLQAVAEEQLEQLFVDTGIAEIV